jgi:hypothetical protein
MCSSVENQLGLETGLFIWPVGSLTMHRQMIMFHNVLTNINNILALAKVDTPITFCGNIFSIITYCTRTIQTNIDPG